jgi:hypothetical protein
MMIQATVGRRGVNGRHNITCDDIPEHGGSVVGRKSKTVIDTDIRARILGPLG